ncbi:MAG: histidine phosphatase family protein [Arenibacterium sp.]
MTRTAIVMRHAKSSWDDPWREDHERPLNKRGRRSAQVLGDWLRMRGHLPDQTLCSSAARTRETFEGLNLKTEIEFIGALYHAGARTLLSHLQKASGKSVLLIAHNPGIADFAEQLVNTPPDHDRFYDYPTGATLVVTLDISDWSDVTWRSGTVKDFVIPRALLS